MIKGKRLHSLDVEREGEPGVGKGGVSMRTVVGIREQGVSWE